MTRVRPCALPSGSLLERYASGGAFTDCYCVETERPVTHAGFVEAFYTTWLFKIERALLAVFVQRPSTDAQARALAAGDTDAFAAWSVEQRAPDQVLLAAASTRSWLMVAPADAGGSRTRLYFGSAVVPREASASGQPRMDFLFKALLGFHKLYSRALLAAALRKLRAHRDLPAGR